MKLIVPALLLSALGVAHVDAHGHDDDEWNWGTFETSMPKGLSDHTASVSQDKIVYIAGGCDDVNGNTFVEDGDSSEFRCGSISDAFYAFDPDAKKFTTLDSMPQKRYRHSSAIVNNQVWIIGGRDLEDSIISEIDVYDITSGKWTSVDLPAEYQISDHASFALEPSYVYVAGGYDAGYVAQERVYRILATSLTDPSLAFEEQNAMKTARGDIVGVSSTSGDFAYVSGGFTDDNGFCAPLGSTEKYTFAGDSWEDLPELINERGEVVLVELDDHLYSLGGERKIDGICEHTGSTDPGELTVGTDFVEVLEQNDSEWQIIAEFPEHKFRFAAVSVDDIIYTFGGQTAYDDNCKCFKTTSEVAILGEGVSSGSSVVAPFMALFLSFALAML